MNARTSAKREDTRAARLRGFPSALPLSLATLREVTVCSPFHPHLPGLGECGAHFVGINTRHIPWDYYDEPADHWLARHWQRHLPELVRRTGAPAVESLLSGKAAAVAAAAQA